MRFSKSSPVAHGSTVEDLKLLLDMISNPTKAKEVLAELAAEAKEVDKAKKEIHEKELMLADFQVRIDAKEKEVSGKLIDAEAALKVATDRQKDFEDKLAALKIREKEFAQKVSEFDSKQTDIEKATAELQVLVLQKNRDALDLMAKAKEIQQEYELKLAKLKAAMGA